MCISKKGGKQDEQKTKGTNTKIKGNTIIKEGQQTWTKGKYIETWATKHQHYKHEHKRKAMQKQHQHHHEDDGTNPHCPTRF